MPTPSVDKQTTGGYERWSADWHNQRRFDPPMPPRVIPNAELGLVTLTLSVEEIDAVVDRLDGSVACVNPLVCDVVAMLVGARKAVS